MREAERRALFAAPGIEPPPSATPSETPSQATARTGGDPHRRTGGPPVAVRHYPPPPGLLRRLLLLVARPEQWAEMARYPLRVTLTPLVLVIVLAGLATGLGTAVRLLATARDFSDKYDQLYSPLVYADGKLTLAKPGEKNLPSLNISGVKVAVDLANTTDGLESDQGVVIHADSLELRSLKAFGMKPIALTTIADAFELQGQRRIDSESLKTMLARHGGDLIGWLTISGAISQIALNGLWAVLIAFLVAPVVQLAAPKLMMPRRVAYRIALAVTIPLIALGGLLEAGGFAPAKVIGMENTPILWFFAAVGLAFWAGHLASRMYVTRKVRGRGA